MLKRLIVPYFLPLICSLLSNQAWAATQDSADLQLVRQEFLSAEQSLLAGDLKTYQQLKHKLQNYPLLPYLEYQEIKQKLPTLRPKDIRVAQQKLSDTPLHDKLLNDWLNTLAEQKRWNTYLQFSTTGGTITQQCRRLQAMLKTGQQKRAFKMIESIWLHGHSRPKACDPVLNAWIDSGHLTEPLVWQRVELAMKHGQMRLARYLKRFLSNTEQQWVEHWIDLHLNPSDPKQLLKEQHPFRDEIVVHTIKRLTRKDVARALDIWQDISSNPVFTDQQQLSVVRTLASYLVHETDSKLTHRLRNIIPPHLLQDPKLSDKQFQVALRQNDWNLVLDTIDNLTSDEKAKERWRYWRARALSQLDKDEEAEKIFKSLSQERSYYGFLAADRLGIRLNFLHETLPVTEAQVSQIATLPGLLRARELLALNRALQARREWNLALRDKSTEELKGAAKLAHVWNWPSRSIMTLARIRYWNDLELRFPLNHRQQVDQQAKDHDIESAWIYAILRQESAFITDARSQAGAMGLMQLMPATARQVASKVKNESFKINDLFQPKINIELGTSYLNKIYRQLQENPVLATAAYNAGPRRVMNWLPDETQATDIWIETVPFRETRKYLKRVLAYTLIYNHRLGNTPERLPEKWLKPIEAAHLNNKKAGKSRFGA